MIPGAEVRVLVEGAARGTVARMPEPLSFWGGLDPRTGVIIDRRHPCWGTNIAGRILVMPSGRGSSSSSSVLAEAIRCGTAPAAIVMREPDGIVALGAIVAVELYGIAIPVVVADAATYGSLHDGDEVVLENARLRADRA
jgi:uncharacterized protein